ncbi:MAG: FAD-binding oxidoreductase [Proteobacteria bacterium]|nr:FAD-binding oxidoreductase [Pseudomonadota bacterium]
MAEHVIVVGGGIIGASVAYHLAKAGARVTVLEKAAPASGASSKSFGWINAKAAQTRSYYKLRREAIYEYLRLCETMQMEAAVKWDGSLWWEDQGQALLDQATILEDYGYEAKVIDAARFSQMEPNVANPPAHCISGRIEGAADGAEMVRLLLAAASANGAHIVAGCAVHGLRREGGRIVGVDSNFGPMHGDRVVVATGAWSQDLLARSGVALPMDNKTGVIVHSLPVEPVIEHIIMSPDIHFRQDSSGRIIMGEIFSGGGLDESKSESPVDFAQKMLGRLKLRLPDVKGLVVDRVMVGKRPVPLDGMPAVGVPKDAPGLYVAVMHSGITLAPLIGRLVAQEISGGKPSALLADFRPTRFS